MSTPSAPPLPMLTPPPPPPVAMHPVAVSHQHPHHHQHQHPHHHPHHHPLTHPHPPMQVAISPTLTTLPPTTPTHTHHQPPTVATAPAPATITMPPASPLLPQQPPLTPNLVQDTAATQATPYSPYWVEHATPQVTTAAAPAASPSTAPPYQLVIPQARDAPPRPRKPYTTTKVREMWSPIEHERMLEGLRLYKRDWAKVTQYVGTRSAAQVRSHAQKYFDKVAREKTDEFVPLPRPKRKSATPYPRKARDERQPISVAVPVPVPVTPAAVPVPMHHVMPMTTATPSPLLQTMGHPPSPYLASAHGIYASPHTSPVSYMPSAHFASPQSAAHAHMYGMFSPLTPYPPQAAGRAQTAIASPVVASAGALSHGGQYVASPLPGVSMPQQTHAHVQSGSQVITPIIPGLSHRHTHSHRNGTDERNCAKCMALQKYGAVLHEIEAVGQGDLPADQAQGRALSPEKKGGSLDRGNASSEGGNSKSRSTPQNNDTSNDAIARSKQGKGGRHDSPKHNKAKLRTADSGVTKSQRMHRSKVVRTRKERMSVDAEKRKAMKEFGKGVAKQTGKRTVQEMETGDVAGKNKNKNIGDKHVNSSSGDGEWRAADEICNKTRQNSKRSRGCISSGNNCGTDGDGSGGVDSYSPSERREIYDAVHSLQILAKRSSSPLSPQSSSASSGTLSKEDTSIGRTPTVKKPAVKAVKQAGNA